VNSSKVGEELEAHSLGCVFLGGLERDASIQPFQGFLVYVQLAGPRAVGVAPSTTFIHNHGRWGEYPLKISASSAAIPSRLLATSSIFPSTLSMSGDRALSYRTGAEINKVHTASSSCEKLRGGIEGEDRLFQLHQSAVKAGQDR